MQKFFARLLFLLTLTSVATTRLLCAATIALLSLTDVNGEAAAASGADNRRGPALVLPRQGSANKPVSSPATPAKRDIVPSPRFPSGEPVRIEGVTNNTVIVIARTIGCPAPASTALSGRDLDPDTLNCIARKLWINLSTRASGTHGKTLLRLHEMIERQEQRTRALAVAQPFSTPYKKRFGRLSATFSANIRHRIGKCPSGTIKWQLPDNIKGRFSADAVAAGRTAPLAAYLLRKRDVTEMLAATRDEILPKGLSRAVCTAQRPELIMLQIDAGDHHVNTYEISAKIFFEGGPEWRSLVEELGPQIANAANDSLKAQSASAFLEGEAFVRQYGNFKNAVLMRSIINGSYRPRDFLPAHQLAIRRMFVRYQALYSDKCLIEPPKGLPLEQRLQLILEGEFRSDKFVYTRKNRRTGESVDSPRYFSIRPQYAELFHALAQEEIDKVDRTIFMQEGIEAWTKAKHDIDLFIANQKCLGPEVADFEKNLARAAALEWDPQRDKQPAMQLFIPGITLK